MSIRLWGGEGRIKRRRPSQGEPVCGRGEEDPSVSDDSNKSLMSAGQSIPLGMLGTSCECAREVASDVRNDRQTKDY